MYLIQIFQLGAVQLLKTILQNFDVQIFDRIWMEFDVFEILLSYLHGNGLLALDVGFQINLIEIIGKLMIGKFKIVIQFLSVGFKKNK
jgi:hypothetical protein